MICVWQDLKIVFRCMFLVTDTGVEGAACMLYPKILLDICEILKNSFYIIPSSIHEVLILPSDNTSESREILAMIKEINDTQVSAEEILSYSLYYYDGSIIDCCKIFMSINILRIIN